MLRPRLCALALVPVLAVGAAACGGGDGVPPERRAAADAAFAAMQEDPTTWPSCGQWLDASDSVRSGLSDGLAEETPAMRDMTGSEVQAGLDGACQRLGEDENFWGGVIAFGFASLDWREISDEAFEKALADLPDS